MEITQHLDAIDAKPFQPLWSADAFDPSGTMGISKHREAFDAALVVALEWMGTSEEQW